MQTQYTDDGITNSQLLLASDIVEGQSVGILSRLKLDQVNNDTQELILTQTQAVVITQPDVEWVETVQNLVESCERGGSIIKSEILCKVTKDEDKVREVCGIVTEWNNHITSEALYCYDKNLEAYTKGLADIEMKELIEYRPGRPKVFETAKELNEWFQLNLKIQESLEDQSLAASYLARLKKFQILEQMFSSPKGEQQNFFNKHQKSRAKAEYLLMKFAVENHSLGLNILRFVNIPWSKFSACKEFRNFIDRNGLEFPVVAEPSFSKIKEVGEEIAQDDFVCTQDFKMNLTDRDLRTLDHNKWLNDQVIAHYGANLIATSSRTDFYLIHSTVFALGSNCRMVPVKNNFKVFAITANLQNQHWALVLIHLEHQKIFYVDSWPMNRKHHFYQDPTHFKKNGDVKVKFKALLTKIEDKQQSIKRLVFSIMGTNGFDVEKFDWVECVMPVQKNGNDCGVYVLKYLEDFLENEHELLDAWGQDQDMRSRYDGVKINEYRDHIKSILE